jgi:hypothetical protein
VSRSCERRCERRTQEELTDSEEGTAAARERSVGDGDDTIPRIEEAPEAAQEGGEGGSMWNGVGVGYSDGGSGDGVREKGDVRTRRAAGFFG